MTVTLSDYYFITSDEYVLFSEMVEILWPSHDITENELAVTITPSSIAVHCLLLQYLSTDKCQLLHLSVLLSDVVITLHFWGGQFHHCA